MTKSSVPRSTSWTLKIGLSGRVGTVSGNDHEAGLERSRTVVSIQPSTSSKPSIDGSACRN